MEQNLALDILDYLRKHPQSQDTVEGITEWWLLERPIERRLTEVQQALDSLVASRFVIARAGLDSIPRYQVNPGKLAEIQDLVENQE